MIAGRPILATPFFKETKDDARYYKLTELHAKLDEAVRREINRRAPDQFKMMALKRRKLRVRDLLARLAPKGLQGAPSA